MTELKHSDLKPLMDTAAAMVQFAPTQHQDRWQSLAGTLRCGDFSAFQEALPVLFGVRARVDLDEAATQLGRLACDDLK